MKVGTVRETKIEEYRVALTAAGAGSLVTGASTINGALVSQPVAQALGLPHTPLARALL